MRYRFATLFLIPLVALAVLTAASPLRSELPVTPREMSPSLDSSSTITITRSSIMSTSITGNAIQVQDHLEKYVAQFGGSGVYHAAAAAASAAVREVIVSQPEGTYFSFGVSETISESSGLISLSISYSFTNPLANFRTPMAMAGLSTDLFPGLAADGPPTPTPPLQAASTTSDPTDSAADTAIVATGADNAL